MKKLMVILLALVIALPCAVTLAPAAAKADRVYIISDSDTRALTREELLEYQYDTLMFAFNEIYARHGYKFETGSRCYNWFTQMDWYHPNPEENSKNHSKSFNACSKIENDNVDLIKAVRQEMRDTKNYNPKGKGMPTPPARDLKQMKGFTGITLKAGQKLPVYSAPSSSSYRAANGKAQVSTNGAVYTMGLVNGWLLVMYETNNGQARIGYVDRAGIKGDVPALPEVELGWVPCQVVTATGITDDPARTGKPLAHLAAGTQVVYLTTMYNSGAWDYIETTIDGKTSRGFVQSGTLSIDDADELDAVDQMEKMGQGDG